VDRWTQEATGFFIHGISIVSQRQPGLMEVAQL
jgi:hypothetical protein